jgi:hypothetical protein
MLLTTFQLIITFVIVVLLIILPAGFFFEKYAKKGKAIANIGCAVMVVVPLSLYLFVNYFCPVVYIIDNCGSYREKTLILPVKSNGVTISYNRNCYIVNNSESIIVTQRAFYADDKSESDVINQVLLVKQHHTVKTEIEKFNYVFEKFPLSITQGKYTSAVKDGLFCYTKE